MHKLFLSLIIPLALLGSTTALGWWRPEKECVEPTVPVLYLDRWTKRECDGIQLILGGFGFTGSGVPVYGHTLYVPLGYEVLIVKEPLFGIPRDTLYHGGTSRFVSYFVWDSPIIRVEVMRLPMAPPKIEKRDGL
jgi:hypothetical protein